MKYKSLRKRRAERAGGNSSLLEEVKDCEALYKGGSAINDRLDRFIPKPPNLSAKTYAVIENEAKVQYVNFFASIINYYSAFLFSFPLVFSSNSSDPYYSSFKEDCNGNGMDLQDLLKNHTTELLASKTCAVAVNKKPVEAQPANAEEADKLGSDDIHLKLFPQTQILDYEYGSKGELLWIIVGETSYPRVTPLDSGNDRLETYWVYDTTTVTRYEFLAENDASLDLEADIEPVSVYEHNLGQVPVALLDLPDGKWLGKQLRNPCVANLRARTALGFHTMKTGFPVPVFNLESPELLSKDSIGEFGLVVGKDDKVNFLVPPAENAESLEAWRKDTEAKIYRAAALDFMIESEKNHSWRSAAAKLLDTSTGHTALKDYGSMLRDFAERVLDLVSAMRGDDVQWDVSGFENLDNYSLSEFTNVLSSISKSNLAQLSQLGPTFAAEAMQRLIALALPDVNEQTKEQMVAEIRAAIVASQGVNTPSNDAVETDDA